MLCWAIFFSFAIRAHSQVSVARMWNEVQLKAIRQDLARPPVQARNLFHVSLAMYDAWALYDPIASTHLIGQTLGGNYYPFTGYPAILNNDTIASQQMAISFAAYRVLSHRYQISPNATTALARFDSLMIHLGYDTSNHSTAYLGGTPAEVGNYIAEQVILMGYVDGAHESINYANSYYAPVNPWLNTAIAGNANMLDVNRWQPLTIYGALDQNGNPIPSNQVALCHEWGDVLPFSLDVNSAITHTRDGQQYKIYFDPGGPSVLDTLDGYDSLSLHYKWANSMVGIWSSFLDPNDTTMWDISPASSGNLSYFPMSLSDQYTYYDSLQGGDKSTGYALNPVTGLPYSPQWVKRGDYTRVISQYWADGPQSETPPGHWYVMLNQVADHPLFVRKMGGVGNVLTPLEWDVKSYITLGGAMHDAAICAWGLKGWYDSPRPISAIRKMARYGQSSDSTLPSYHKAGLRLIPGFIELIDAADSMAVADPSLIGKIKMKAWKGFSHINNPATDVAGVGWIPAENWMPYQRKTFVTPPFAGYVSGHSTYSRAGAEVMENLTGSEFFPGGLYETLIPANSGFLFFEAGPSTDIALQWAKYKDASNEASLSRIYGCIHPPTDDGRGRYIGSQVAHSAFQKAQMLFNNAPLPVDELHFSVVQTNCSASIQWSATHENNIKQYEVWRSPDGSQFSRLALLQPVGKDISQYAVVDDNPDEQMIYRLIEIDTDNKKNVLAHTAFHLAGCGKAIAELNIFPNPVSTGFHVAIPTSMNTVALAVMDIFGKSLINKTVTSAAETISVSHLAPGNYLVKVIGDDGRVYSFLLRKE